MKLVDPKPWDASHRWIEVHEPDSLWNFGHGELVNMLNDAWSMGVRPPDQVIPDESGNTVLHIFGAELTKEETDRIFAKIIEAESSEDQDPIEWAEAEFDLIIRGG